MSRIQLPSTRTHNQHSGERRTASRPHGSGNISAQTDHLLREMAFVLEATRRVREAIVGERAELLATTGA